MTASQRIPGYEQSYQNAQRAIDRMARQPGLTARESVLLNALRECNNQNREIAHHVVELERRARDAEAALLWREGRARP